MKDKYKEEIDFKDLIRNPIRLFGWIFPLTIIIFVAAGVFYIKNLDNISFNQVKPVLAPQQVVEDIPMKKGAILPAIDLAIVKNPQKELISKGKELYDDTCASCHGNAGKGDGVAGSALNPPPRNFISTGGWTNGRDIVSMYKTLQEGIVKNGMAAYEYIIPEERLAILHYIRTLGEFPEISDEQVEELDLSYALSSEIVTSNQIPVKSASAKIIDEHYNNYERLDNIKRYLAQNSDDSKFLGRYSMKKDLVLASFINNPDLETYNIFRNSVLTDPQNIGFKESIVRKTDSELRNIHSSLVRIIESGKTN